MVKFRHIDCQKFVDPIHNSRYTDCIPSGANAMSALDSDPGRQNTHEQNPTGTNRFSCSIPTFSDEPVANMSGLDVDRSTFASGPPPHLMAAKNKEMYV